MNKPGKSSLFKASLLASLLATAFTVQAAGLGKLTVYSAIGQPLSAEVALTATAEELASLSAKLGTHDAFKEAGVEFMPALTGLRFSVVKLPNNQAVLKLTTDRPLNEPFLHFLLELNWTAGRMVREYTFLLDPPETLQTARPASVVTPVAPVSVPQSLPAPLQPAPQSAPVSVPVPVAAAKPITAPAPVRTSAKPAPVGELQVKSGDTLSKIARDNKSEAVSLDQMLVALFNSNRDAFDGNNMNRLRAGKILRLPDAAEAAQVDADEARKMIVSQAADFNAYRRRLAAAADARPATDVVPQQQATGRIKPQVEEKAPPPSIKDKLEVSRTEASKSAKADAGGKGSLEEDLIARDKALREAAGRIAELEKNLENLKQLVELKSQAGAQLQQQAKAVDPKPVATQSAAPPAPPVAAVKPLPVAPAVEKPQEPVVTASQPETAKPAEPAPAPAVTPPKPAVKKPVAPPPPEPSFIEDSPELVFGGGGLLALLLGYFGYTAWRKKKQAREEVEFASEPSVSASDLASKSGAVFGAASESVDSGEVSIQGDFSEGGVLTTEESVDPVAEADVYMAYGRDSQAEEILLEGLKVDPTRSAIHLKLLELYANRKSVEPFEGVARQLHGLTEGQGPEWAAASNMAATLGISGGLFAGAETNVDVVAADMAAESMPPVTSDATTAAAPETVITSAAELAQEQEAEASAEEDAGSLDFDLDLGTTSGPAAAPVEQVAEKPAAEEAMSLDFDFDLGTPEPAASLASAEMAEAAAKPVEAAAEIADVSDSNAIDFSLDIDTPAVGPEVVAEDVAVTADDGNGMDFDLDLGSAAEAEAAPASVPLAVDDGEPGEGKADVDFSPDLPAVAEAEPELAPAGGLSDLKLDFDLELDAAESASASPSNDAAPVADEAAALDLADISLDLDEPAEAVPVADEVSLDELALPEIELPAADAQPATVETGAAESAMTDSDFDLMLGAGADVAPEVQPDISEVPQLADATVELPDIDLSADFSAPAPIADEVESLAALPDFDLDAEPAAAPKSVPAELDGVADDPEVATKLELAQAYEEMGDREGARELLNEVVAEGSSAQQALARTRLAQLNV